MLKNEIIKIFGNKILLYVILIALLLNGGLICWQQFTVGEDIKATYQAYNEFGKEIEGLSEQEKIDYITSFNETLNNKDEGLFFKICKNYSLSFYISNNKYYLDVLQIN